MTELFSPSFCISILKVLKTELFGPSLCILILKVLKTEILGHSLDFTAFCMIQEYFSQTFQISKN